MVSCLFVCLFVASNLYQDVQCMVNSLVQLNLLRVHCKIGIVAMGNVCTLA